MKTIITPEVDMLLVARSSQNQRKNILNFAPRIGLSVVDYGRLDEIDTFYINCQNFRDYYKDPYNKLKKPVTFHKYNDKCGLKVKNKCIEILTLPLEWIRERRPVICPIKYNRQLNLGEGFNLAGVYDATPCLKYKR